MAKVLQIIPSLNKINGGVERGTLDVAKELISSGFDSAILSSGGEMSQKYKYLGVEHHELSLKQKGFFRFFFLKRKFLKIIDSIKPDIVHIRSRWPAFCFNSIIKQKKITAKTRMNIPIPNEISFTSPSNFGDTCATIRITHDIIISNNKIPPIIKNLKKYL